MGTGYVIDNYISCFRREQTEKAFKVYITDNLRLIAENTAKNVGGSYIKSRYIELIEPQKEEENTGDGAWTIVNRIKGKLRAVENE